MYQESESYVRVSGISDSVVSDRSYLPAAGIRAFGGVAVTIVCFVFSVSFVVLLSIVVLRIVAVRRDITHSRTELIEVPPKNELMSW